MKKLVVIALAFMTTVPMFAQLPDFHSPVPPRSMFRDNDKPIIRTECRGPNHGPHYTSPNSDMAALVAITGAIATFVRGAQELSKPPPPTIVFPTGVDGTVIVREMEPVVRNPVPITIIPMEIMTYP